MAPDLIEKRAGGICTPIENAVWIQGMDRVYECRILVCPEDDGEFSAHALRLPGIVSQGASVDEAVKNICDAFGEAIRVYLEGGGGIPWQDIDIERTKGCFERWMLVNV